MSTEEPSKADDGQSRLTVGLGGKCDECGKAQADGWALYCVSCAEIGLGLVEACGVDVSLDVPDRDYASMTPKDCYEVGLIDGAMATRKAIRDAITASMPPNANITGV